MGNIGFRIQIDRVKVYDLLGDIMLWTHGKRGVKQKIGHCYEQHVMEIITQTIWSTRPNALIISVDTQFGATVNNSCINLDYLSTKPEDFPAHFLNAFMCIMT